MKLAAKEVKIEYVLRQTGAGGTRKGFWPMVWSIRLAMEDPMVLSSVTGILYPRVAGICGMSTQCVMRDLRSLVDWCWTYGDRAALHAALGRRLLEKPTVGEFVDMVAGEIRRMEMEGRPD